MYQLYEDQAFLIKVYLNASVFVASECWDKYRLHPDSCMAKTNHQHHSIRLFFLNWLVEYLSKQEVKDTEVWNALQKALWAYHHPILHRLLNLPQKLMRLMKSKLIKPRVFPATVYDWLSTQWKVFILRPRVGSVDFGSLRRVKPISRRFGYDRGLPIDRCYIESFLARQANDIRGRVLEIGDDSYTRRFGGSRVTVRDVFHVTKGNPKTTFIGDLTSADHIPSDTFDCIILTQTLDLIYDVRAALKTLHRILKPGGIVLATVPGISPVGHDEWTKHLCWSFTTLSARRLFEEVFPAANVKAEAHGNVLAAIAFLHGLSVEELSQKELDYYDSSYQVLITIRAAKAQGML
jgi:SAM-dependent methyltransferase